MIRATLLATLLGLAACGPGRTSAATQPSPAAFDPSQSDAATVELATSMMAALGDHDVWDKVQQLTFTSTYTLDGQVKGLATHHWDRWNGRHNFQSADLSTDNGTPDSMKWIEVYYDLFDDDARVHGYYDGNEVAREDAARFKKQARSALDSDGYMLTMVYKLLDPGVKLKSVGDMAAADGVCEPSCKTIEVTFDPAVGKDTWYVNLNADSLLPEVIEKLTPGGRIGFHIEEWTEAGGLKFPSKLHNLGLVGEVFTFTDVAIGAPDDRFYIPQVTGD